MKALVKTTLFVLCLGTAGLALAAPSGFNSQVGSATPQGFNNSVQTVNDILSKGYDDQPVVLRGRLTAYLGKDHYEFTDLNGDRIEVELDDDFNWGQFSKDQLIDLYGDIDKDFFTTTVDAKGARAVDVTQQ